MANYVNFQAKVFPDQKLFCHFELTPQRLMNEVEIFAHNIYNELRVQAWRQVAEQKNEIVFSVDIIHERWISPTYSETINMKDKEGIVKEIDETTIKLKTRIQEALICAIVSFPEFKEL